MSYLLDKKLQKKRFFKIIVSAIVVLILFYFRLPIFRGLSSFSHTVFRPVLVVGGGIGEKFSNMGAYFKFKSQLQKENKNLKLELDTEKARASNYNSILDENLRLKGILGRTQKEGEKSNLIVSAILSKPNQSLYDTLIIDVGEKYGIKEGDLVLALGNVPIGKVSLVYANSSKVILFSNPKEKTDVVVAGKFVYVDDLDAEGGGVFTQVVGRGGGNFEMVLPRDLTLLKGTEVHLPGITPYVVGVVETIISDPRDAYQKALLVSPVNIQELNFVEVVPQ